MRYFFCSLLLGSALLAQQEYQPIPDFSNSQGTFYVDGISYQFAAGKDYTVVAAAHSVINHKFLSVKLRVYNAGQHSITVKPENVLVEDAIGTRALVPVSAAVLANKMRKPYNMARYAVNGNGGGDGAEQPLTSDMMNPQFMEMMRAMAARPHVNAAAVGQDLLYTDTPGALESDGPRRTAECDQVCRLRMRESQETDALAQLQRQTSPDYVEQCSLRSNTIPPQANVGGILYFPLGKLAQESSAVNHIKKRRIVRVTVPVDGASFQFVLLVE
jgi:hypothetical protein